LQRKQPKKINGFAILAEKSGPAKQEQHKRLNADQEGQ